MKKFLSVITILLIINVGNAQIASDKIAGNWYNEDLDKTIMNAYKATDGYWYAKIINSTDSKKVGKILISKLKFNSSDNNYTGTLTSPNNNMEANATITFTTDGKLKLVAKKLFITKTYLFLRVK